MGTLYGGVPSNVVPYAALSISSSTNATPVQITTSAAHGLLAGDVVDISGHVTNTNVNGIRTVLAVTSSTAFTVNVAGVGVGGATGTVQLVSRGAATLIYSDGDGFTAAATNQGAIPTLDRASFALQNTGVSKLAGRQVLTNPAGAGNWATSSVTAVANTWYAFNTNVNTLTVQTVDQGCTSALTASAPTYGISGVTSNDLLKVTLQADAQAVAAAQYRIGMWYVPGGVLPGASPPAFSVVNYTQIPGCGQIIPIASLQTYAVSMTGYIPSAAIGTGSQYIVVAWNSLSLTGAQAMSLSGDSILSFELWRQTGWPQ